MTSRALIALDFIARLAGIVAIIALLIFVMTASVCIYKHRKANGTTAPLRLSLATVILSVFLLFAASYLGATVARRQLIAALLSPTCAQGVTINERSLGQSSKQLMDALKNIHWTLGHHSHPTTRFTLTFGEESCRVSLILARDSENPHEYWIFLPARWMGGEIGRINTISLDGI